MTQAITPSSAANALEVSSFVAHAHNTGTPGSIAMALFQDATANALNSTVVSTGSAGNTGDTTLSLCHCILASLTTATTFRVRIGGTAGTTTFNGSGSARTHGGVHGSHIIVKEIMA